MSATVRICTCVAAYVPAASVFFAVGVSVCAFISVHKCVPCIQVQLGEHMCRCPTCAWDCVYSRICVSMCVEMNERCQVLLLAVPAASGAICVGALWEGNG